MNLVVREVCLERDVLSLLLMTRTPLSYFIKCFLLTTMKLTGCYGYVMAYFNSRRNSRVYVVPHM